MLRQRSYTLVLASAVAALAAAGCGSDSAPPPPQNNNNTAPLQYAPLASQAMKVGDLGVAVTASGTRPFIQTNKGDAYLYGEAAGPHETSWQGFNVRSFRFIDDWQWTVGATALGSTSFTGATVYPDRAVRSYQGGLSETVTLVDDDPQATTPRRAVLVEPSGATGAIVFRPLMFDSTFATDYQIDTSKPHALAVARKNHMTKANANDWPVWIVIKSANGTAASDPKELTAGGLKPQMMSVGSLTLASAEPVVLAVGDTLDLANQVADDVLAHAAAYKKARADRMQALLDRTYVRTADAAFDPAYAWIRLQMDALVMNQQGVGIFAGLPWFNNYWGRDTFISLGGSHLATGEWEDAKAILASFSTHQDANQTATDSDGNTIPNPTYGRIPNTVSLGGTSYNTADGTPWFVIQAYAYILRSGDTAFAKDIWPVVKLASDGSLQRIDTNGFLKHGDQETWMDANGPTAPYTPRGDRAVEIQGLWYQQLLATAEIAKLAGESASAATYQAAADKVAANFTASFYDAASGMLVDHLAADGTANKQIRPNQFLALRSLEGKLDPATVQAVTRKAAEKLAYPHGVASLNQLDDAFHPWHIFPGRYPKDEAYHNGVVWGWLAGPMVSLMVDQGEGQKAYEQLQSLAASAMTGGANIAGLHMPVGTLSELYDALPPPVDPNATPITLSSNPPFFAGTVFQAWSHGEYLRNVNEDFLGVKYLAADHVQLKPQLPQGWGATTFRFRVGPTGYVTATLTPGSGTLDGTLVAEGTLARTTTVTVVALGTSQDVTFTSGASQTVHLAGTAPAAAGWDGFAWQQYQLRTGLTALAGQGWMVLDNATIKQAPGADVKTIASISDPQGDDTGPAGSTYTYPTDLHFQPGILDLTGFELREDAGAYYFALQFANLVQPGWNPADGFQLTYAAVLLDTDNTAASGQASVQHKALYTLPNGMGYEYGVYVGAGFELQDGTKKVLAQYTPFDTDVLDPLGSASTKAITFRIPKTALPQIPTGTTITVLTGSQDDYGTGIMGDFRAVGTTAGQWTGGGKTVSTATNVYDFANGTTVAPY